MQAMAVALAAVLFAAACAGTSSPSPSGIGGGPATTPGATPPSVTSTTPPAGPTASPTEAPEVASPPPSPAPTPAPTASPAPTPTPIARPDLDTAKLRLTRFATGFQRPVFITTAGDGSGRLYVVEQRGRVFAVSADGKREATAFLDLRDRVSQSGNERGLLGLAFHPGYAENGRLFADYTARNGDIVVAEYRRTGSGTGADRADPGSERVLLRVPHPRSNHNGGMIAFGADGMLYVAVGDGGGAGDPDRAGQNVDSLLAKILRIDVDGSADGARPYSLPSDNPFVDRVGARPEIWDLGLRNPWRFSFDRVTGALFIGDVGQDAYEEIDVEPAGSGGKNYGWSVMEGRHCYRPSSGCQQDGLTLPSAEYGHHEFGPQESCSVTGGYVYRGWAVPALRGAYVFGDYCSGLVWGIDAAAAVDGSVKPNLLLESGREIVSFGEDDAGELFLVDLGGSIYRITDSAG
jgi:glucose/arabinose dehydrogenase